MKKNYFVIIICWVVQSTVNAQNINRFLFDDNSFEFVDLTQTLDVKRFDQFKLHSWYSSDHPCTDERSGTYIDSKFYNPSKGDFVDRIPLENLIVPLIIADISEKVNGNANFMLYKHHLDYFLNNYFGNNHQPCLMVFKFGWSKYYSNEQAYYGVDRNNTLRYHPGLSVEVAEWITTSYKNIVGVGVDLPAVDAGFTGNSTVHEHLTKSGLHVIQNIKLDQYVPEAWCTALTLPLKTSTGSPSSPLRLVAICPKSKILSPNRADDAF